MPLSSVMVATILSAAGARGLAIVCETPVMTGGRFGKTVRLMVDDVVDNAGLAPSVALTLNT